MANIISELEHRIMNLLIEEHISGNDESKYFHLTPEFYEHFQTTEDEARYALKTLESRGFIEFRRVIGKPQFRITLLGLDAFSD